MALCQGNLVRTVSAPRALRQARLVTHTSRSHAIHPSSGLHAQAQQAQQAPAARAPQTLASQAVPQQAPTAQAPQLFLSIVEVARVIAVIVTCFVLAFWFIILLLTWGEHPPVVVAATAVFAALAALGTLTFLITKAAFSGLERDVKDIERDVKDIERGVKKIKKTLEEIKLKLAYNKGYADAAKEGWRGLR